MDYFLSVGKWKEVQYPFGNPVSPPLLCRKKAPLLRSVYACVLPVRICAAFCEIWEAIDSKNAVRNQTVKLDV